MVPWPGSRRSVGQTSRPAHDEDLPWEETPAFHPERQLLGRRDSASGICVSNVGRRVCRWKNGKPRGYVVRSDRFFSADRIHLSRDGCLRLDSRFPEWLTVYQAVNEQDCGTGTCFLV